VGVRSGDTSQSERQKQLRRPPHIFITTPESLAMVLAAPKFREKFADV
jgi:ATP-dependent Lhr-like helicase